MKIRIAAAIALAAGVALGASGCSLIAPQGTNVSYSPSDGVEVTTNGVYLRNIILVADETGENFNLVFTAVNTTGAPAAVNVSMTADNSSANVDFKVPTGTTPFGNADEGQETIVVTMPGLEAGATAKSYFTLNGETDIVEFVPVLDGTLKEYQAYVLAPAPAELVTIEDEIAEAIDIAKMTTAEIEAAAKAAGETVEEFTARVEAEVQAAE